MLKRLLLNLVVICLGLAIIPITLEIGLRFFPVFSGMPVNRASAVYSFTPNTTIVRSANWDMSHTRQRQVNNAGFISDQVYDSTVKTPLIAIVGDSYIEAMQVDYPDTAEANLLAKCSPNARVYSFGAQFAPLSQYLSWVQYAGQTYQPKVMVVNINGNDFDESLLSHQLEMHHGGVPGMQFFDFSTGSAQTVKVPFENESLFKQALRHSVLAQYLVRNVGVVNIFNDYRVRLSSLAKADDQAKKPAPASNQNPIAPSPSNTPAISSTAYIGAEKKISQAPILSEYVGNAKRAYTPEKLQLSKRAVDTFLKQLPQAANLPAGSIVLSVDAERPLIYTSEGQHDLDSFFSVMRQYLLAQAKAQGFIVLDLRPAMIAQFSANGKRFEFDDDNHWNARGHQLMAQELYRLAAINRLCTTRPD
jgi:hypothetical protein